ncbi:MAG: PASTA domain-containing protein [Nitrospirae bacterium]|nr:PASTA domain-containing protein [Nitrospirota bacterium]MDA1303045.1 PASTA domain-containing protein [Nitrospirota bacterium]
MWSHENEPALHQPNDAMGRSAVNASAFDFDADGDADLFFARFITREANPGNGIYIVDGADGTVMAFDPVEPGSHNWQWDIRLTLADVDGDGAAEMVYGISNQIGVLPVRVLQGLPGNPWPPTRAVYNQHHYQPMQVNADSSIPQQPRPHWLIPGLNSYRAHPVVPGEDPGATDRFRYTASDGTATSNEATVTIAITNVNAPIIVSRPPLGASPGHGYLYGVLATDADFGDVFTYTLVDAPAGMTIDSFFGIVNWLPDSGDLGNQRVQVVVSDSQGNTDEQSFTINVAPPVIVPNLVGSDETGASGALGAAGLAVGSIAQAFSLTVPAGVVISQSVMGATESAAGAFIDFVISLGPQPIFVPSLVAVSEPVARSLLESVGLNLGAVTQANSNTVPAGLVLAQGTAANQQVAFGTSVAITVSSGPSVKLELDRPLISSGDTLPVSITLFDNTGVALDPQPPVVVSLDFDPLAVVGVLPVASSSEITTASNTSGAFTLIVDAGALGSAKASFIVRTGLAMDTYYGPIAELANTIDDVQALYTDLVTAVADNDLVQIQALGVQLQALRGSIDLEILADRTPFAPETGFIPSPAEASAAGFPATFTEGQELPEIFRKLELAINDNRIFLERLDPNVGRDDDVRARSLNNQLATGAAALNTNVSVGAHVVFQAQYYVLLSRLIPELMVADLDRSIAVLTDAGLLTSTWGEKRFEGYASVTPQAFYADTRDVLFTLGGVMSAGAIRTSLIKSMYIPHITRLLSSTAILAEANALREEQGAQDLVGIITAASLSLHIFETENSVIEVAGVSNDARAFQVQVIGPDKYQVWLDFVTGAEKPGSVKEAAELAKAAGDAAADSQNGTQTAVANNILRGCILEQNLSCSQLVLGFGFPVVHKSGAFPGPVIVILRDVSAGKLYASVYAFFPKN